MTSIWNSFAEWGNAPLSPRFDLRRLDVLLALFGILIFLFYWAFYSWQWAVIGVLMYGLVLMLALWVV